MFPLRPSFACFIPTHGIGRAQLRFLRSSVLPSLHALMLVLMTNCVPRVRGVR